MNNTNKISEELKGIVVGTLAMVVITIVSYIALVIFG
jgi:hypothetical protein